MDSNNHRYIEVVQAIAFFDWANCAQQALRVKTRERHATAGKRV